jgi:hypothetical protein
MSEQLITHLREQLEAAHRDRAQALENWESTQKQLFEEQARESREAELARERDKALVKLDKAEKAHAAATRALKDAEREAREARTEAERATSLLESMSDKIHELEEFEQRVRNARSIGDLIGRSNLLTNAQP